MTRGDGEWQSEQWRERRDEQAGGEEAPHAIVAEKLPVILEAGIFGKQRRRKLRRLARRHEADRQHPQQRCYGQERDERGEAGDQRAAHQIAPARLAKRNCTSVTARTQRKSSTATAAPEPRFHHLNPSSYMK